MTTPLPSPPANSCDMIRAAGVKVTRQRVRVLDALLAARQPLCHGELDAQLGGDGDDNGAAIDRVTLYRILDSLVGCGLALKAVDPRGVFRFSAAGAQRQHAGHVHFRCTDCGGVFCLAAEPPPPPKLPRGFQLGEVEFDVRGTCAQCTRAGVAP
ncbi:MAG: transcriptional repressor [Gammaproteobacteria bacterium]|nr:transcriptional repressor [Gammaproteobacteria bacterium]MBU3988500.1 transcriptional repressor [Gammaproteobacteria bacterium]MBU4003423.1 transcriptional repressor [Gammaproteobacteria bacterium]MBU4021894.1 transcriptional repressor [Gammaproteobacteria bacterium]MBU4095863.1 transcriptional repressor [Gammaproteobacteria bacterium]